MEPVSTQAVATQAVKQGIATQVGQAAVASQNDRLIR
jgi:hypothetical protein